MGRVEVDDRAWDLWDSGRRKGEEAPAGYTRELASRKRGEPKQREGGETKEGEVLLTKFQPRSEIGRLKCGPIV